MDLTTNAADDPHTAVAALEQFVVDNDALNELEQYVGRFNIFDALGIIHVEIRHSNFLAWLLDPGESHNQGSLFLRAWLMDLLRQSEPSQRPRDLSPITLDGGELRGVEVRREWRHIDLLIRCKQPNFVIAVENKIHAGEHSDQLDRYKQIVREQFGDVPRQFVFLTPEGDEPSDADWTVYDYRSLHDILRRVVDTHQTAIGADVRAFAEHYLRVLRSHLMDDPKIDELCRRIYQNHRQAIDLIVERVGSPTAACLMALEEAINQMDGWRVINRTNLRLQCMPTSWRLPPINRRKTFKPDQWLFVEIRINADKGRCMIMTRACPTTDPALRRQIVERLIDDPDEFGMTTHFKSTDKIGTAWTTLGRKQLMKWSDDDFPEEREIVDKVTTHLQKRRPVLDRIPKTIEPIIAEWEMREQA